MNRRTFLHKCLKKTDKQRLLELFNKLPNTKILVKEQEITLDEGTGFANFTVTFSFDKEGNLRYHTVLYDRGTFYYYNK